VVIASGVGARRMTVHFGTKPSSHISRIVVEILHA